MAFTREQVAEIYVATFNRAPDAAGLDWWMNDSGFTNIENVASSFFDSAEAAVMYPAGTSSTAMVESAYQNLFGRASDPLGLAYWVGELDAGRISQSLMLQAMINGAKNTTEFGNDATMMENKTTVGISFADSGLEDVNSAQSLMSGITDDVATVTLAQLSITTISDLPTDQSVLDATLTSLIAGKTLWGTDEDEESGATIVSSTTFSADMTDMSGELVYAVNVNSMYINDMLEADYDTNDYMQLLDYDDESLLFLSGEGELLRWYYDQTVAEAILSPTTTEPVESTGPAVFAFSSEWLNSKILYNIWDEDGDSMYEDAGRNTYQDGNFLNPVDGSIDGTYTIDDNGIINLQENGDVMNYIKGFDKLTELNGISLVWGEDYNTVNASTYSDASEYFFLDESSANTFMSNSATDVTEYISVIGSDNFVLTLDSTVDTIHIGAWVSEATAGDVVSNFQTNKLDGYTGTEGAVNDILDLPTNTIAADVVDFDGIDSGSIISHSVSSGWITFNGASDNSNITDETFNDVVAYLMLNIADGDTVKGIYNGSSIVFQGGTIDTAVVLVGVVGAYLGTTAGTDTILIA